MIELLAVIAIIAVLAALLAPLLGNMIDRSVATVATNRLKQTYVAFQNYAAENDGNLPAAGGMPDVPGEETKSWTMRLQPYADGRPFTGWQVPQQFSECFVCPVWAKTDIYKSEPWQTGFAMNYRLARPDVPVSSVDAGTPRRQAGISSGASKKILVAPGTGWGVEFQRFNKSYLNRGFNGPKRYGNKNPNAPQAQQKGYGLYLFLDGHVEQLNPDQLDPFFL